MAKDGFVGPLPELDLGDEFGSHPARSPRDRSGRRWIEWRRLELALAQLFAQALELGAR